MAGRSRPSITLPANGVVEPMQARQIDALPTRLSGRRLLFEPKWDGFRALTIVDRHGDVGIYSRRGTALKQGFPEIAGAAFVYIPHNTVLDGELVCWHQGRLDFGGVQRRNNVTAKTAAALAAVEPCHFIAFDVLRLVGVELVDEPLSTRRIELEALFSAIPAESTLALGMQTDDLAMAREWFDSLAAVGVEGIVIKPAVSRYVPGHRGWEKVKHYSSTEFIIGGVTGTLARPEQLQLGRYTSDTGEFRLFGRTVPLHASDAEKVAAAIRPAGPDHPWPDRLPGGWVGPREIDYVRVDPTIVVEVRVDTAAQAGRWRHGLRFLRLRPDLDPSAVPHDMDLHT